MLFYHLAIWLYGKAIGLAALRNAKARAWIAGRRNWKLHLSQFRAEHPGPLLWVHAASVGEYEQAMPVLDLLKRNHPDLTIALTFFSPSGYERFHRDERADGVFYLPLDTRSNARAFVGLLRPQAAFIVKYEFWLNLLQELDAQHVPVVVAPAIFRPDQFFFKPWGRLMLQPLKQLRALMVQDETSMDLLKQQGFTNVSLCGDSRLDRVAEIAAHPKSLPWLESFLGGRPALVLGSTWPADEAVVLPALDALPHWAIIIVTHEIHAAHIRALAARYPGDVAVYSQGIENQPHARHLVVDTTGLLAHIYRYARIAYVGGGFTTGIHSILEPAAFGMPLLFGPDHQAFREADALLQEGAAQVIRTTEDMRQALIRAARPEVYEQSALACRTWIQQHAGAKHRIAAAISDALLVDAQ